jgi:hypothetical protein
MTNLDNYPLSPTLQYMRVETSLTREEWHPLWLSITKTQTTSLMKCITGTHLADNKTLARDTTSALYPNNHWKVF